MRKMQERIVEGKRISVGLEDSKKTWKLCCRSENMIVHETGMPTRYEVLRAYLRNRYPGCEITVMYEAGFQGFWLHDLLVADGIGCVVTPPNKVSCPKDERVKTDKRDARLLAKNLENRDYVACAVPDREQREDRQVSRTLNQVQKDIVVEKNRIRRFLDFHGLNAGLPEGDWTDRDYRNLSELPLSPSLRVSLDAYLRILETLRTLRVELLAELKKRCKKERYQAAVTIKQSVPGIGWLTAIRLTLEWGSLSRFPNGKCFAKFTGLTCREYSTGETIRRGRITGQSSEYVRAWLIECAWRAIRKDPALQNKFQRVWRNSGSKKKAIVAVARKIAVRIFALEHSGELYQLAVAR
jgi:transposase